MRCDIQLVQELCRSDVSFPIIIVPGYNMPDISFSVLKLYLYYSAILILILIGQRALIHFL